MATSGRRMIRQRQARSRRSAAYIMNAAAIQSRWALAKSVVTVATGTR